MRLAAVTAYFNPCGWRSRKRNYDAFRNAWRGSGVPLLTVECTFRHEVGSQAPTIQPELESEDGFPVHLVTNASVLWQKERLLNIGLQRLADQGYDGLLWVDADLLWLEPDWPQRIAKALETNPIVQCFDQSLCMYDDVHKQYEHSAMSSLVTTGLMAGVRGGAWAVRAECLPKEGLLYDRRIVGGGDSCFAISCAIDPTSARFNRDPLLRSHLQTWNHDCRSHYCRWLSKTRHYGQAGYVKQAVQFLPHGKHIRRQYGRLRDPILRNYNPTTVTAKPDGPLTWMPGVDNQLRLRVYQYFYSRKEDEVCYQPPSTRVVKGPRKARE